jgi:hypothetical protein
LQVKGNLAKRIIIAVAIVIVISFVAVCILPKFVYISSFSAFYVNGIVDSKMISHGTNDGEPFTSYSMSVNLFEDDPLNKIKSGNTLGYIVSESDWNQVEWGDIVKIKIAPLAQAEIVNLYPATELPAWHQMYQDWLNIEFTSDKSTYASTETVNFTVELKNIKSVDQTQGGTLSIFKTFSFWAYNLEGNQIRSTQNVDPRTQAVTLSPNQIVSYSFQWPLNEVSPGYYTVRVFIGYIGDQEDACLTGTQVILVR